MHARFLAMAGALLTAAVFGVACEKSNEQVLREQFAAAAEGCPKGCSYPPDGCVIKGNISGAGRKFYIMPADERYPLAIIDVSKGEAWFCTAEEAEKNGFNPVPPGI